ncbi:uncharacterized protein LOC144550572 isoform X1 [Carex rostrata]
MKHSGLLCLLLLLSLHSVSAARLFISTEPEAGLSGIDKANALSKKGDHEGNTEDNPCSWEWRNARMEMKNARREGFCLRRIWTTSTHRAITSHNRREVLLAKSKTHLTH